MNLALELRPHIPAKNYTLFFDSQPFAAVTIIFYHRSILPAVSSENLKSCPGQYSFL